MTIKRNLAWLNASLALTVVAASPAFADDTELLLQTATASDKPNILFILDSSGSMDTLENTSAFYDSNVNYDESNNCDDDSLYWSNTGLTPGCNEARRVRKSDFVCAAAALPIADVGSYTGVVAEYREQGNAAEKWQTLGDDDSDGTVECADDSGIHGEGTGSGDVYAKAGSDDEEFTSDPDEEVDWQSYPTNSTYTLYDGNYLNWRADPGEAELTRIDIVKTVLKKVLSVYSDVNLGLMRFNETDGGPVVHALKDLASNRTELEATLDAIDAAGNTPLSETFYEAALYWQGLSAHYGDSINEYVTDPVALPAPGATYAAPQTVVGNCPRNFNILLTDGEPTSDEDAESLAPGLPGWEQALGRTVCDDYSDDGDCLDDISEYLFKHDINTTESGNQFVRTFGIGFLAPQPALDLMQETVDAADGKFFLASDPESLATSLLNIFDEITEQSLTFTSPAVAVNAFNRTQNLNDLYMTVFQSKNSAHWPGNLKKYRIVDSTITDFNGDPAIDPTSGFFDDNAQSFWSANSDGAIVTDGGAANVLPIPTSRNVYTNNTTLAALTSATNTLTASNAGAFTLADFGLTGAAGEPTISELIRWATGEDVADVDNDSSTTVRYVMGDPLHSQPAAVDYGTGGASNVIVFAATNDGYLHAVNSNTGVELWSFVPKEMLGRFAKLFNDPSEQFKQYGIDGDITPVVFDEDGNGELNNNDFVYVIFGLRRGGNNYYALDVTNPNTPAILWQVTNPEFGQSWSTPVATRILLDTGSAVEEKKVIVVGAGYDTIHDSAAEPTSADGEGAGIFMLDIETGATIWQAGPPSSAANLKSPKMTRAFPTSINVIDINGDRLADRMYAADVGGQIWRFDIFEGNTADNLVTGGVIAQFGFEGVGTPPGEGVRRVYNTPDVSIFTDELQRRRFLSINIGTGYRAHPLDSNAVDRFFSLRDEDVFNQLSQTDYDSYDIATDDPSDMVEVSSKTKTVVDSSLRGWQFTLPDTQMVLSNAATFNNAVFFVAFSPEANGPPTDCDQVLGKNFLYEVSVVNGDPIVDNIDTLNPVLSDAARGQALQQGGIAPEPRFLFPSADSSCVGPACSPPPLGCVGAECFETDYENNPVRTLWTQDGIE